VVLLGIQTIDNYFIEPNVVGGQVHLAALPTILGIITGGIIWGPAGMILFIPMLAIAKIIFDHVEDLKPYGYLIGGQNGDEPSAFRQWIKRLTDRIRNKKT
jgi:predicted PurR-regulated permease PerM